MSDDRISVRELQRHAAEFLSRVERGESFVVTRRGAVVARILPPDPADEALQAAVAAGVLDPAVLDDLPVGGDLPEGPIEEPEPGGVSGSEAILAMREDRWE